MAVETTITAEQLGKRCGVNDEEERARLLDLAVSELDRALEGAFRAMPQPEIDECILRIGRALKDAGKTSTGAGQLQIEGGATVPRTPSDPLASSRKIISRYVAPF